MNQKNSRNKLRVLFINMINPERNFEKSYPPLGPAYLASYIYKHIGNDKVSFQLISSDFEKKISELHPDIVGITCVSQNYDSAKRLAKFSKGLNVPYVLIGGSHISLCPESLDPDMDIGVLGEGEVTFLELVTSLLENGKLLNASLGQIPGIIYWEEGKIQMTRKRDLIKVLDDIPMPDRSLFKTDVNKAYMFSSRGCPYNCIFCASSRLWEKVRFNSAGYVFNEIKELFYKHGVRKINFADDLFIANRRRIKELSDLLEKEGLIKKIEFHVSARANLINDDLCQALKKMNVIGISLGLESGSAEILKYLKGTTVTVEDNLNAVATIKKHGFYCYGSFIIGAPVDTKKTIMETLDFIKKSKIDKFAVNILLPFPGTPVWKYAVSQGLVSDDIGKFDWRKIDVLNMYSGGRSINLSGNLEMDQLYKLYLLFEKERKKREIKWLIKLPFTNTGRIFLFLFNRLTAAKRILKNPYSGSAKEIN